MSATRCPGTGRGSTTSCRAGRRSRAGRCTATCSRRCARVAWRSVHTCCSSPTSGSRCPAPARVRIGGGRFLNIGVMVAALELVEIGEHCMFANGCVITDANHRFDDPDAAGPWQGFTSKGPTRIGDNVWCGAHVVVTSGVTDRRALRDRRQLGRHHRTSRRSRSPAGAPATRDRARSPTSLTRTGCSGHEFLMTIPSRMLRHLLGGVDRVLEALEQVLPADHDHRVDAAVEQRGDRLAGDAVALVLEAVDLDRVAARCR